MKKILAIALAVLLCVSCLAVNVWADTTTEPYVLDMPINEGTVTGATAVDGSVSITTDGVEAFYIKLPVALTAGQKATVTLTATEGSSYRLWLDPSVNCQAGTNVAERGSELSANTFTVKDEMTAAYLCVRQPYNTTTITGATITYHTNEDLGWTASQIQALEDIKNPPQPITVDLLINAANIKGASIAKGVATFDGTTYGNIVLPVPVLPDETIRVEIEGYVPATGPRVYLSNSGDSGMTLNQYNQYGADNSTLTLNGTNKYSMDITANAAGGATHLCIKSPNYGGTAPAGLTIAKVSITYWDYNVDEDRQEAIDNFIEAQAAANTAFSFMYKGKYYEGDYIVSKADSTYATGAWQNAPIESSYAVIAQSGARVTAINGANAYLKVTVSGDEALTKVSLIDRGNGAEISFANVAFLSENADGTTSYFFKGSEIVAGAEEYGSTYKEIRAYGETGATIVKIEEVNVATPTIYDFNYYSPVKGLAYNTSEGLYYGDLTGITVIKTLWREASVSTDWEAIDQTTSIFDIEKQYDIKMFVALDTAIAFEDVIATVGGEEVDIINLADDGKSFEIVYTSCVVVKVPDVRITYNDAIIGEPWESVVVKVDGEPVPNWNWDDDTIEEGTCECTYYYYYAGDLMDIADDLKAAITVNGEAVDPENVTVELITENNDEATKITVTFFIEPISGGNNKTTGWICTGDKYHAMMIGRAIITLPHEFGTDGDCVYCHYNKDTDVLTVSNSYESTEEETEDVEAPAEENPETGIALAILPAALALAVVTIKRR